MGRERGTDATCSTSARGQTKTETLMLGFLRFTCRGGGAGVVHQDDVRRRAPGRRVTRPLHFETKGCVILDERAMRLSVSETRKTLETSSTGSRTPADRASSSTTTSSTCARSPSRIVSDATTATWLGSIRQTESFVHELVEQDPPRRRDRDTPRDRSVGVETETPVPTPRPGMFRPTQSLRRAD